MFVDLVKIIKSLGIELLVAEKSHLKSLYWGIFANFGQTGSFWAIKFKFFVLYLHLDVFGLNQYYTVGLHEPFRWEKILKSCPFQTSLAILILSLVFRPIGG